jgi:hypothetical protein
MLLLSLLSLFGAITYKLYSLNNWGVLITVIFSLATFITIQRWRKRSNLVKPSPSFYKEGLGVVSRHSRQNDKKSYFSFYSLLLIINFSLLINFAVSGSIISPWQIVPWYFFITYTTSTILLIFIILKKTAPTKLILITLSCHYFLSFSVAWIIYKIGYGFDPFIHQATLELIDKNGAVDPKPFYYLGQYALEIITHKIFFIPIAWIDKILVPLLAAIYLPAALYRALTGDKKTSDNDNRADFLTIILFLILPFSFFIVTTPQNLAYLFLILVVLLSLSAKNKYDYALLGLLSLSACVTQPIAGIPAVLFSAFTFLQQKIKSKKINFSFSVFYFLILIFTLPMAFYLFNGKAAISLDGIKNLFQNMSSLLPLIPKEENFILNFIYLYGFNLKFVLLILIAIGVTKSPSFYKEGLGAISPLIKKEPPPAPPCKRRRERYLFSALALFLSWILINIIPFNFLIFYERDDYPERILTVAIIFLLPFILVALQKFAKKIINAQIKIKIPFLIFISILISTSLYLSYPRFDNKFNSRGYSTGENDIKAVQWINDKAGENYIVLANQQVSAAALREFGFKKYYDVQPQTLNSDPKFKISNLKFKIFYYPVPTGEALYQYYLDMVYKKPGRETMLAAMNLAGVNKGYFVLNKYWWAFPKILDEAKLSSSGWQSFGDGEVWVFEYVR